MSEIAILLSKIDKFLYPDTMKFVKGEITRQAFFPGGRGLFNNGDNTISDKKIMILGQDFDCETNYLKSRKAETEDIEKNPTWRNLLCLLKEVNIAPDNCFFTNAILGIRVGNKGTGKSPAFKDKDFIKNCQCFLLEQLAIQKPKAIFVLGKETAGFLALMTKDLECWKSIKNFTSIDGLNKQVIPNATFNNGVISNLVLLTHPSFRPSNIHRRSFRDIKGGHTAEVAMINSIL